MTQATIPVPQTSESSWLSHQWVVAGLVAASARFIPIPYVDDIVRRQCRRFVVSRTLASTSGTTQLEDLKPYYDSNHGFISGAVGTLARAPLKLLLFPIRKVVAIATSIRGVPLEVIKTVLLGRTLQRQLQHGAISADQAVQMRYAFDDAFARMDFRTLRAAIHDAIRSVRGWKVAAMETARNVADAEDSAGKAIEISAAEPVETGASKLQQVLEQAETAKLFAKFDERFDTAYARRTPAA